MLEAQEEAKYKMFRDSFVRLDADIDPQFKPFLDIVEEYKLVSGKLPSINALLLETQERVSDKNLNEFIQAVAVKGSVQADTDMFISSCRNTEIAILSEKTNSFQRETGLLLNPAVTSNRKDMSTALATVSQKANILRDLVNREANSTASVTWGEDAIARKLRQLEEDKLRLKSKDYVSYDYGIDHFKDTVRILPGDLLIVGGFTSHGKSIELRRIAYHLQMHYTANVFFLTFESVDQIIEDLLLLRHAGNKKMFPNTPTISKKDFKDKTWTFAQESFFTEAVVSNYYTDESIGTLKIQYPGKSRYTLEDLRVDMMECERNEFPIHAVVIDYSTKMWPISSESKKQPDTSDYNLLFGELKQLGLNWRSANGEKRPIPVITAAQISRAGLKEAIKNENIYDEAAFSHYSEIERSADTLMTVMMTPDMKDQGQFRMQQVKGRNTGVQTEPVDLAIDLQGSETVGQISGFSPQDVENAIMNIF